MINYCDNKSPSLEEYLCANARDGVQALIKGLWEQPTRPSDDGTTLLADLPAPTTVLPREKPV